MKTELNLEAYLNKHVYPIQIGETGYIELVYRPARIQQHGRLLQPPRHIWVIRKGESIKKHQVKIEAPDEQWLAIFQKGISGSSSFELPGLGMCYKHEGYFELLPAKITNHTFPRDYGLSSLSVKPLEGAKKEATPTIPIRAAKTWKQSNWWLKIAAVFLVLLFINLLTFQLLTEDGKLSFNQVAELNPFDSLIDRSPFTYEEEADIDAEIAAIEERMTKIIENVDASPLDTMAVDKAVQSLPSLKSTEKTQIVGSSNAALTSESKEISKSTSDKMLPVVAEDKREMPSPKVSSSNSVGNEVQIVVGAFSSNENAVSLKSKLQNNGWSCSVEKANGSSLYRVVVRKALNSGTEQEALNEIKGKINPQAWILAE